jgi:hypothetical protein
MIPTVRVRDFVCVGLVVRAVEIEPSPFVLVCVVSVMRATRFEPLFLS